MWFERRIVFKGRRSVYGRQPGRVKEIVGLVVVAVVVAVMGNTSCVLRSVKSL